eukprot:scaffold1483_cov374-Pavlova_lutheri.AAC.17
MGTGMDGCATDISRVSKIRPWSTFLLSSRFCRLVRPVSLALPPRGWYERGPPGTDPNAPSCPWTRVSWFDVPGEPDGSIEHLGSPSPFLLGQPMGNRMDVRSSLPIGPIRRRSIVRWVLRCCIHAKASNPTPCSETHCKDVRDEPSSGRGGWNWNGWDAEWPHKGVTTPTKISRPSTKTRTKTCRNPYRRTSRTIGSWCT